MPPDRSIHDNFVYAYHVDCEGRIVVLHTAYRDREPIEFTDVVFRGVIAHYFEHGLNANILFDVSEIAVVQLIEQYATVFESSWRYGWPPVEYRGDLQALAIVLRNAAARAYSIDSSYGLSGWVLGTSCEMVARTGPASSNMYEQVQK